ncbi:MAG: ABC transporter permease [Gammaproteobacteria bacterium]|nr:ABC transporter permease [Gammaproteobacteria bacterium]
MDRVNFKKSDGSTGFEFKAMILSRSFWLPIFSAFLAILIWEIIALYSNMGEHVFPGPVAVLSAFDELFSNGALIKHSVASLYRVTVGFYLAALLGIPLGIILGLNRTLSEMVDPIVQFLRPISPLAWIPLAMLWLGIGDKPAIFLIFLSSFFSLIMATTVAVKSINPIYFQVAANFNFSRLELLTKVIVPAITPDVITALRLTVAVAWLVVVAAEMIAVQSGLGYLILDSRNALRMDFVMVGMIVIGWIGLSLDLIMQKFSRLKWTAYS